MDERTGPGWRAAIDEIRRAATRGRLELAIRGPQWSHRSACLPLLADLERQADLMERRLASCEAQGQGR